MFPSFSLSVFLYLFLSFFVSSSYFIGGCPSSSRVIWAMESKKWTDGWSSFVICLLKAPSVLKRHWAIFIDQFIVSINYTFNLICLVQKETRISDQRIWLSKIHVAVSEVFKSLLFLLNHFRETFAAALRPVIKKNCISFKVCTYHIINLHDFLLK